MKIYNIGNMLNDDWGKQTDSQQFGVQIVDGGYDSVTGQYIFEDFSDGSINDLLEFRSLWEARIGLEVNFR